MLWAVRRSAHTTRPTRARPARLARLAHLARPRAALVVTVAATCVALAAGCGGDEDRVTAPAGRGVVVASFNFAESVVLAEIYAQALAERGIPVRMEHELGPRELVMPALLQGHVDVVPEYAGSAAVALGAAVDDPHDPDAVAAALARALAPWDVALGTSAGAQNVNGVVVERDLARRLGLRSVSDLAAAAPSLTLGGPPECPARPYCLRGLERVYGLRFARFVPLETATRVRRALEDDVVDAGILFTTDGQLADRDLALLVDDRGLQPAEHVVPVVRRAVVERYGRSLVDALDAVSAALTTESLRVLNWRVAVAGNDPAAEARAWLIRHRLVARAVA
jgi:osmoprotectant transport system substrate-binding protein